MEIKSQDEAPQQLENYFYKKKLISNHKNYNYKIIQAISLIDQLLDKQLREIFNHPTFQALQASWIGLHYLTSETSGNQSICIRILNTSWEKLAENLLLHNEVSNNSLFELIYSQELDMPGGRPYGLLIGDYYLDITEAKNIHALHVLTDVCAEAFVPYITGLSPATFGIEDFKKFSAVLNSDTILQDSCIQQWNHFRQSDNAHFLGLLLPKILYNTHYERVMNQVHSQFIFKEIWGHPAYALAAVIGRCYANTQWFLESTGIIRSGPTSELSGGVIPHLLAPYYTTDRRPIVAKCLTEVCFTESQEVNFSTMGFIPVSHCSHNNFAVFNVDFTAKGIVGEANIDSYAVSLQYMLCICRFAHYIKSISRDKIGSHMSASQCEHFLQSWINRYVASNLDISTNLKTKYPLRIAKVKVVKSSGWLRTRLHCILELSPHLRTTQIAAAIILKTNI